MNKHSTTIQVDLTLLPDVKPNHELRVRENDPESGLHHAVSVKRIDERRLLLRLRDWPGDRFALEVDLMKATVQLRNRSTIGTERVDALIRVAYEECVNLLCAA